MLRALIDRIIIFPCVLFLGGCWFSPAPIVTAENASAIPFAGTYSDPDGSENPPITITKNDAGQSYQLGQGGDSFNVHFLAVDEEWYVVQITDPLEEPEVVDPSSDLQITRNPTEISGYNLLRWSSGVLRAYETECTDEIAEVSGVEANEFGCVIGDEDALVRATRRYAEIVANDPQAFESEVLEPVVD